MIFQIFLFLKYVHEPHVEFMRKLPKKILKRLKRVEDIIKHKEVKIRPKLKRCFKCQFCVEPISFSQT